MEFNSELDKEILSYLKLERTQNDNDKSIYNKQSLNQVWINGINKWGLQWSYREFQLRSLFKK